MSFIPFDNFEIPQYNPSNVLSLFIVDWTLVKHVLHLDCRIMSESYGPEKVQQLHIVQVPDLLCGLFQEVDINSCLDYDFHHSQCDISSIRCLIL